MVYWCAMRSYVVYGKGDSIKVHKGIGNVMDPNCLMGTLLMSEHWDPGKCGISKYWAR